MTRYWRLLLPAYLFTWPVFFSTLSWALLVHFLDSVNNDSGNVVERVIIISILHVVVFTLIFISKKLYLDRLKPAYVPGFLFITLALVSILRGYLMENWLFTWEITSTLDIGLRMRTSLLNTLVTVSIAIIAAANTRQHQMTKSRLLNELDRLENVKLGALSSIDTLESRATNDIKNDLLNHLQSIQTQKIDEVLQSLKTLIDKVVQPLSRKLESEFKPWTPPEIVESNIRVNWFQVFKTSLRSDQLHYLFTPGVMVLVVTPTVLENSPLISAFLGLGFSFITGAIAGKFGKDLLQRKEPSPGLYFLLTFVIGLVMGISSLPLTQNYDARYGLLILSTFFYPFASSIISLLTGADEQVRNASKQLESTTQELEWNVARVRESQHKSQRELARSLHGTVQAKISSSYIELENLKNAGQLSDKKLTEVLKEIEAAILSIGANPASAEDLIPVLQKVKENWAAVAEISIAIDPNDVSRINQDPLSKIALLDVVPELVFNAVKHGRATHIDVSITFMDERTIRLDVLDNGKQGLRETRVGLGTKILDEAAISWLRERRSDQTLTSANFAFKIE
jgi:two-component system NarL family sensor kinase